MSVPSRIYESGFVRHRLVLLTPSLWGLPFFPFHYLTRLCVPKTQFSIVHQVRRLLLPSIMQTPRGIEPRRGEGRAPWRLLRLHISRCNTTAQVATGTGLSYLIPSGPRHSEVLQHRRLCQPFRGRASPAITAIPVSPCRVCPAHRPTVHVGHTPRPKRRAPAALWGRGCGRRLLPTLPPSVSNPPQPNTCRTISSLAGAARISVFYWALIVSLVAPVASSQQSSLHTVHPDTFHKSLYPPPHDLRRRFPLRSVMYAARYALHTSLRHGLLLTFRQIPR